MFLAIRYLLIIAAGWLASMGLAVYDDAAQTITFQISDIASLVAGIVSLIAAIAGRWWAKAKGWLT